MVDMPKKVKIGSSVYTVEQTDKNIIVGGAECIGSVSYWDGNIQIAKSAGEGIKPQTLMHEIIHAITVERMGNSFEQDEKYIDGLAAGILMLIRNNPKLINYIVESGKVNADE